MDGESGMEASFVAVFNVRLVVTKYGLLPEKFLRIYGLYFYDLNGTTPYLGNSSYPPPGLVCHKTRTLVGQRQEKTLPLWIPCISLLNICHSFGENPFVLKKTPSKIRKNLLVLKISYVLANE